MLNILTFMISHHDYNQSSTKMLEYQISVSIFISSHLFLLPTNSPLHIWQSLHEAVSHVHSEDLHLERSAAGAGFLTDGGGLNGEKKVTACLFDGMLNVTPLVSQI